MRDELRGSWEGGIGKRPRNRTHGMMEGRKVGERDGRRKAIKEGLMEEKYERV